MYPVYPDLTRSIGFVQNQWFRGRRYKRLAVINEYARQFTTVDSEFVPFDFTGSTENLE